MKNKESFETVEEDFIEKSFSPVENNCSSSKELERIKKYSDENLNLIFNKLNTKDEEEKRNIIVNLIAALDYYIHEIIIWGITQITLNGFPKTERYEKLEISINYLKDIKEKNSFDNPKLKRAIIEKIRKNTFQKWKDIKEGLSLILRDDINKKIGKLTTSSTESKAIFQVRDLKSINEKRNLIVHHFDRAYEKDAQRNTFDIDCQKSYDLIKVIIESIHKIIEEYDETQPENDF